MSTTLEADRQAGATALDRWAVARAMAAWGALDLTNPQGSFLVDVMPGILAALVKAQETAAELGGGFVDELADQAGPVVIPRSFAGVAADGRALQSLVAQPLIDLYQMLSAGAKPSTALGLSAHSLDEIVTTEIHDTARSAEQSVMTGRREFTNYQRVVEGGACGRCVILAGRVYRFSQGFLRHPRCRCSMRPVTSSSPDGSQDPRELFDEMSPAEQADAFTAAGAEAIRLGADPARVVNARRGMSTVTVFGQKVQATTVLAGGRNAPVRLMPASILQLAEDRTDAIRLLQAHQFITN